jgi:nitrogen fixation protein FixH
MRPLLLAWCLLSAVSAGAAERTRIELSCSPIAGRALDYACRVKLTDSAGKPVEGAEVTIGADMPSMPMAHSVAPVKAKPAAPGLYEAELALEMHGVWAVKLRLSPPRGEQTVRRLRFEPGKVEAW